MNVAPQLKKITFAKFPPAPPINVDHSFRHYGHFVSGQHCAGGRGGGKFYLQSWPKLCGTSLQNALPRPSISFSHGNQRSLGQILLSPPPPCNVVRKERLADESSNIASGGKGGASENCSNSGKRHFVPHILARIVYITHFHYKRT